MLNDIAELIVNIFEFLHLNDESVWGVVNLVLDVVLLVVSLLIFLAGLSQLLSEKGREQKTSMWLLFSFGLVWFVFSATINLIGGGSCKTKSFADFLLFRTTNFCSTYLALSYAFLLPVILVSTGKVFKNIHYKYHTSGSRNIQKKG